MNTMALGTGGFVTVDLMILFLRKSMVQIHIELGCREKAETIGRHHLISYGTGMGMSSLQYSECWQG